MKKFLLIIAAVMGTAWIAHADSYYFGADGPASDKGTALAQLLPWAAPAEGIALTDENVKYLGNGEYSVTRTIVNKGAATVSFNDVLKVRDLFDATHYTIPCVSYNGNDFDGGVTIADGVLLGKVKVPTGISCDGEPWVFDYQRTGIPSCTLTENANTGLALFAAVDTPSSLVSS